MQRPSNGDDIEIHMKKQMERNMEFWYVVNIFEILVMTDKTEEWEITDCLVGWYWEN